MQISRNNDSEKQTTLFLGGEFDAHGCLTIKDELESMADTCENKTLALNIEGVSFIDSSGVGAIVFLFKRLRAVNGNLKITGVRGQPQELLSLLRVHEAIPVEWQEEHPDQARVSR